MFRALLINLLGTLLLSAASGPAQALDRVSFRTPGAGGDLRDILVASSLILEARRSGETSADQVLAAARADYGRLLSALYAEGRFGAVISIRIDGREASSIAPLDAPSTISLVQVTIQPGPVYRFDRTEIAPIAPGTVLPEDYRRGAIASVPAIEDAALAAVEGWRAAGHAKATVAGQRIVARHDENQVSAALEIAPGPDVRFGELAFEGQRRTREERLREIAGYPRGTTFSPEALDTVANRLRRTGAFQSVSVTESDTVAPDGSMDITVSLAEARLRRLGVGVEYTTTEALTFSAYWLNRNLFKGAERLRIDGEISGIGGETGGLDYSLGGRFTRPGTLNADTDLFVLGELTQKNEPDFNSKGVTLGFGLSRELRKNVSGEVAMLFSLASVSDATGDTEYRHIQLPLGLAWDRRNDTLDPTDGFYLDGEVRPYIGLSGSENGTRVTLDARGFETFGGDRPVTAAARLQMGSIVGASITGLPNDQRFYSGGGGTVRGQDYQSLDVDLGGGARSGGRSFLGLSGELRVPVTEAVSAVAFADWGYVSADSLPGSGGESHSGAGLGIRYATGFGPIRLDVGVPVSGPGGGSNFHLYIGIGQAF